MDQSAKESVLPEYIQSCNKDVDGLFQELRLDSDIFVNYFRMSSELFQRLLDTTAPHIIKNDSFRDDVISPTQRLALTLRYLASGDSMTSLYYAYRISLTMVSNIIRETTAAIWNALESIVFIKCEESRWCQVAADFDEKWNFPHCLGPGLEDAEHNGDLVVSEWRRDVDRSCIQDLPQVGSNSYSKTAGHIRNQFAQYFMEEGAIPWQWYRSHNQY